MKLSFIMIILFCCPKQGIGQSNLDSLRFIWNDKMLQDTDRLNAFQQMYSSTHLHSKLDSALLLDEFALFVLSMNKEQIDNQFITKKQLLFDKIQSQKRHLFVLGGISLLLLTLNVYLYNKLKLITADHNSLAQKTQSLKEKLTGLSVSTISFNNKTRHALDKSKIEDTLNTKLGESSWMILNLIYKNPSISNKEIAQEVSLSLEGVSSSLRRMYNTFNIKSTNNKKVALIMKAVQISTETESR